VTKYGTVKRFLSGAISCGDIPSDAAINQAKK